MLRRKKKRDLILKKKKIFLKSSWLHLSLSSLQVRDHEVEFVSVKNVGTGFVSHVLVDGSKRILSKIVVGVGALLF